MCVTLIPPFVVKRFVAGETIESALGVVQRLNTLGLTATLDFLGENVTKRTETQSVLKTYLHLLDAIHQADAQANISLKLTALGLTLDEELCVANLTNITEYATHNPDPFVRVDMEGSALTQKTLDVFRRVHACLPHIGPAVQAYLKRSPADIERLIAEKVRVRLCKGAYREPPTIAYRSMRTIQQVYLSMAQALLTRGIYPGIATHDERLIRAVCEYTAEQGIPPARFEFQMLYGVRPERQRTLAAEGYNVRVYVPFGAHWASYFRRRIAERRENLFFVLRAPFTR
jgi:proline dehydrogenase